MIAATNHPYRIARGASLLSACAEGRPANSSLGRAATLNHSQHQRLTRTERGKLVGMCASTLGVAKTGRRFAGLGCLLPYLAGGYGFRPFSALSHIDGIGGGCSRDPFANFIHNAVTTFAITLSSRFQAILQCLSASPVPMRTTVERKIQAEDPTDFSD